MADSYATFELAGKWNKFPHCFKPCAPAELKALLKGTLQGSGCQSIGRPGGCRVTPLPHEAPNGSKASASIAGIAATTARPQLKGSTGVGTAGFDRSGRFGCAQWPVLFGT
jgi:hypothetical protein